MDSVKKAVTGNSSQGVVLRRRIPLVQNGVAASWLGGLPTLPLNVEWPNRSRKGTKAHETGALHFLAQISCADLPADLWNGAGPRHGALLFFANMHQGFTDENPRDHRVIFVEEPGEKRALPTKMKPVRDPFYSGYDFETPYGKPKDWPRQFRRWSVDILSSQSDTYRSLKPGPISSLYEIEPRKSMFDEATDAWDLLGYLPISVRQALALLETAQKPLPSLLASGPFNEEEREKKLAQLRSQEYWEAEFRKLHDLRFRNISRLTELGVWEGDLPEDLAGRFERSQVNATEATSSRDQSWVERLTSVFRKQPPAPSVSNAAATVDLRPQYSAEFELNWAETKLEVFERQFRNARIVEEFEAYFDLKDQKIAWGEKVSVEIKRQIKNFRKKNLDHEISKSEFDELKQLLKNTTTPMRRIRCVVDLEDYEATLLDNRERFVEQIVIERLTDMYVKGGPELSRLPPGIIEKMKQYFSFVESVHRMGGRHVDYDTEAFPDHEILLQLSTDMPMQWTFKNTLYFMIRPEDLEVNDFSKVEMLMRG